MIDKFRRAIHAGGTLLGIGVVSENVVLATLKAAEENPNIPFIFIASRRQIECDEFGGGYVNNWSTQAFSDYLAGRKVPNNIFLERDHGGPWQGPYSTEQGISFSDSVQLSKKSFFVDIDSGFDILHIDPSLTGDFEVSDHERELALQYLYAETYEYAKMRNKEIYFEVGTEEQSESVDESHRTLELVRNLKDFTKKNKLPDPIFLVAQTGTKVREDKNVGELAKASDEKRVDQLKNQLRNIVEQCEAHAVYLKAHNMDYLDEEKLKLVNKAGVHAINVAPEFGVIETKALEELLKSNGLNNSWFRFEELAVESGFWKKWFVDEGTDLRKAFVCGHYIFSLEEVREIIRDAQKNLLSRGTNLQEIIQNSLSSSINGYLRNLNLAPGL